MNTLLRRAAMPLAIFSFTAALAACGQSDDAAAPASAPEPSSRTVAATVEASGDLGVLEGVVENAGLATVLEGKGPYTVFAPVDAAFQANGAAADLSDAAMRAQGVALVRAHIVPGALTRADIGAAIDKASGGSVQMRTMADGLLTFTRDGQTIVITAPDGATARLTASESLASNGVVQPVDAILAKGG